VVSTVCSPAKRLSKLGKKGKRVLHFLVGLVGGGILYCSSQKHTAAGN
jgi:hypothetical protein